MSRLSPLSVPYRVLQRGGSIVAAAAFAVFSGASALDGLLGPAGPLVLAALFGTLVLVLVAYEVAYYRRYEYELDDDTFDIRSGVFARRNREIPLRRIQNVDISRSVVQRVLGIAAVDFETAGGSETEAAIRFIPFGEAKRLQREISRHKRGLTPESGGGERGDEPASEPLFALSDRELALVGLLSFDMRFPGALFILVSGAAPVVTSLLPGETDAVVVAVGSVGVVLVVALFSWGVGAAVAVTNYYGFRLVRTADELQYERGLLQRYDGSIPLEKVQTLTVEDNPLKRRFGYATLAIETAGYAPGQSSSGGSEAAVPLARRNRVLALANDIEGVGDPEFERPPKRVRRRYAARYLIALGVLTAALAAADAVLAQSVPRYAAAAFLPLVPVAAHYKWKHRGYWLGDAHVITRNGVLRRQTKAVPYYRVQTVIDTRTLFQRRWNLATVTIDTAGSMSLGGGDAAAVDIDDGDADRLRKELSERLRVALAERRGTTVGPATPADARPDEGPESGNCDASEDPGADGPAAQDR